jgi:hypothetical protein
LLHTQRNRCYYYVCDHDVHHLHEYENVLDQILASADTFLYVGVEITAQRLIPHSRLLDLNKYYVRLIQKVQRHY